MSELSHSVKGALESGSVVDWIDVFAKETEIRLSLSSHFTSPEIERLRGLVLSSGADAIKVLGAGGGGCVLVHCSAEVQDKVVEVCHEADFQVLPCNLIEEI